MCSYVARRFHSGETEAPLLLAATSPPATIDPALYLPAALRQAVHLGLDIDRGSDAAGQVSSFGYLEHTPPI